MAATGSHAEAPVGAGRLEVRTVRREPAILRCSSGLAALPEPGPCPLCHALDTIKKPTEWQAAIAVAPGHVTVQNVPAYWCRTCERRSFAPGTMVALYHYASRAAEKLGDRGSATRLQGESDRLARGIAAEEAYRTGQA
jgi:hypothetical protein